MDWIFYDPKIKSSIIISFCYRTFFQVRLNSILTLPWGHWSLESIWDDDRTHDFLRILFFSEELFRQNEVNQERNKRPDDHHSTIKGWKIGCAVDWIYNFIVNVVNVAIVRPNLDRIRFLPAPSLQGDTSWITTAPTPFTVLSRTE